MEVTAADHARGPEDGYDQLGPHRSSRAIAIVHIAMFDAVNAITKQYQLYTSLPDDTKNACIDTAISAAAGGTLLKLFPKEKSRITDAVNADLPWARQACTGAGSDEAAGTAVGSEAAKLILDDRSKTTRQPTRRTSVPRTRR